MVSHIHATVDDDVKERAVEVKDHHNLTWETFIEEANDALAPDSDDTVTDEADSEATTSGGVED